MQEEIYHVIYDISEYIMWNAQLDEAQPGIRIAGRNINSFRYADDTTLIAESKEELKGLLMKVKQKSEKVGLKLTLCDTMDCSTPGFPVHHQLPKTIQSQVHRLGDAIQPSHPLPSPYPPALNSEN